MAQLTFIYSKGPKEGEGRVIDATRISDGAQVFLKMIIPGEDEETSILQWASSESVRSDPRNHCIPLLDQFQESSEGGVHYVVLPLARNWMLPPLRLAVEALSFIRQILEVRSLLYLPRSQRLLWFLRTGSRIPPLAWHRTSVCNLHASLNPHFIEHSQGHSC